MADESREGELKDIKRYEMKIMRLSSHKASSKRALQHQRIKYAFITHHCIILFDSKAALGDGPTHKPLIVGIGFGCHRSSEL